MASKMEIELALANLEAGKFSFRMVDAIKEHIDRLENELNVVRGLHASAVNDLRRQELAAWRLEGELKNLNAKIYALLKANMLTEQAFRGMAAVAVKMREYLQVVKEQASPKAIMLTEQAFRGTAAAAIKMGEFLQVAKKYALPKAIMLADQAFRGMTAAAIKIGEYLQLVKEQASPKVVMLTEKAFQELTPVTIKMAEHLQVVKKNVGASLEKAKAYFSTSN